MVVHANGFLIFGSPSWYPLERGIHVSLWDSKESYKENTIFLSAIEYCGWEFPKENFYHGLGAVLFICCKNEKSDGLTLLTDKIKAV